MPSVAQRSPSSSRVCRVAVLPVTISPRAGFPAAVISVLLHAAAVFAPGDASAEPDSAKPSVAHGADAALTTAQPSAWLAAYTRGHWSAAIELLETIPDGSRTAWHWLHLARARDKRGQLVEAFAAYERLREIASEAPRAPGMKEIAEQASNESAAIAGRIPWAEVTLGSALPAGTLVFVDQQWLEPSRLRSPYPVNPGWHTFLVESNGGILAARRVHFEEGQDRVVPLTPAGAADASGVAVSGVAPSGPAHAKRPPAAHSASGGSASGGSASGGSASSSGSAASGAPAAQSSRTLTWHAPEDRLDRDQRSGLKTAAFVSLGIGGLGTLIGTGLAISALQARERSDPAPVPCFSGSSCNGTPATEGWQSQASGAALSYTVGLIGLVTGGVLWLAHREYTSSQPTLKIAQVEIEPRVRANGAALHGRF